MQNSLAKSRRGMKRSTAAVLLVILVIGIAAALAFSLFLRYRAGEPEAASVAEKVKIMLCLRSFPKETDAFAELSDYSVESYSGARAAKTESALVLQNSAMGYSVTLPADTELDFSFAPSFVKAKCPLFSATLSREYSTEKSAEYYAEHYFDRFLLSGTWREANGAHLLSDETRGNVRIFTEQLDDIRDGRCDVYTYVNLFTGTRLFYRMMFKYRSADAETVTAAIDTAVESFSFFRPSCECEYGVSFAPESGALSEEAQEVVNVLKTRSDTAFGVFTDGLAEGDLSGVYGLENELSCTFDAVLIYRHLTDEFPTELMEQCADCGKLVELTYQMTTTNNLSLDGYSPQLDIYRGGIGERIRAFAESAADFGRPMLLRLSNEMNSDWTSWSGITNMCDPEIYVAVWQRIHNIFIEEGATNVIWVWNPNDRDYPPAGWNAAEAYWPGEKYVDIVGVTGYNTGSYYSSTGERWRSFRNIYGAIDKKMSPLFGAYPWIITEFSSASEGGSKAKWVDEMFAALPDFPNIRLAVWFDSVDLDASGDTPIIARDYRMDDTPETVGAFRRGFAAG